MRLKFCVACGNDKPNELHHHHLIAPSEGGSDEETNLITLCVECPGKLHGVKWSNNHSHLIREGQRRARAMGTRIGRPRIGADAHKAVVKSLAGGNGVVKTAKLVGVGVGTVVRIKRFG